MKPLNEGLEINQLSTAKQEELLHAFHGASRKEIFKVGTPFFRFVTPQKGDQSPLLGNAVLGAEWWFGEKTHSQISQLAHEYRIPFSTAARVKLAITTRFNREMEYICGVIVTLPICGLVGQARWQEETAGSVYLPGGAEQVYFPSMGVDQSGLYSKYVKLNMWAYVDDMS